MAKVVDIDIVFDTETIEKKYGGGGTKDTPKGIAHADAYMVARQAIVRSGQATADLSVNVLVNDTIRWRANSLSGNTDQAAIVYKIVKYSGVQVTDDPKMIVSYPTTPIPDPNNPISYTANNQQADVFMNCTVRQLGTEGYQVWFYIVNKDPDTGKLATFGYYYWDPTLNVIG